MEKVFKFPAVRIVSGLILCLSIVIIGQQLFVRIPGVSLLNSGLRNLIKGVVVSVLLLAGYTVFYRKFEKRTITELSASGLGKKIFLGLLIGSGLQCLTISVIYLYGGFKIISINPLLDVTIPFTVALTVAIIEETLLRGIIFRIIEERSGSTIALIISGILFGGLHVINPHVTVISVICIAIIGVLLSAAYMYYKSLWFPIAIHFAWNFTQNGVFGAITSGNEKTGSLLTTKIEGPGLITGGQFGPEASIQALLFCTIATIIIMLQLSKQNKIISRPVRHNNKPVNISGA